MDNDRKYVLAMYDVRGKQNYIYRSKHIKEIMGASFAIEDIFRDFLFPAAKEYNDTLDGSKVPLNERVIYDYNDYGESGTVFSVSEFEKRMSEGNYLGEVVYEGGGNFFVLYRNAETCVGINRIFTRNVLKNTQTLTVLSTYIDDVNFNDYKGDRKRLYEKHRRNEQLNSPMMPSMVLPVTQTDSVTSLPLSFYCDTVKGKKADKITTESYYKYYKYDDHKKRDLLNKNDEVFLDELVTKKGEESLLAIIYADGNNMGAKVRDCLREKTTYEECVKALRIYSKEIQRVFIEDRIKDIDDALGTQNGKEKNRRAVISAGDEITIICNARNAYKVAVEYLKALPEGYNSCAGIAVFHSHTPFSDVYTIAEECCESGKQLMKKNNLENGQFIDFHFIQSGIGSSLEQIREEENEHIISKPWYVCKPDEKMLENKNGDVFTTDDVDRCVKELQKTSRTNIKGLLSCARNNISELKMEIERITAHGASDLSIKADENYRKLLYDVISVYDIWFRKEENEMMGPEVDVNEQN